MKWIRRVLVCVVSLVVLVVALVFGLSNRRLHRTFEIPKVEALALPTDSAELVRGEHIAVAIAKCAGCHGDDYGGKVFVDNGAFGHVTAPNLTRGKGGVGATFTDAQFLTAVTHGVHADGTPLLFMPSAEFAEFARADVAALLAYIRRRPAVNRESPAASLGPIGRMLIATNQPLLAAERIDHAGMAPDSMPAEVTVAYGKYLATVGGCTGCHNSALSGGPVPGAPPEFKAAANLTRGGLVNWTLGDFRRALREGKTPSGTAIDSFMPWRYTQRMTDGEIEAVWMFVQSLPPREFGKLQ